MNKKTQTECEDKNCVHHGSLNYKKIVAKGTVVSNKMNKTAVVSWTRKVKIPKYERFENRRSKISVHNPPCIDAKVGDLVEIALCRPLSKTKTHVITKILGKDRDFLEKEAIIEEESEREEVVAKEEKKKEKSQEEMVKETEPEKTEEE